MKKKIILLLLVIFLCGCEAKYNIKISDDRIEEEITITEKNEVLDYYDDEDKELFEDELNYWELDLDYYKKININDKDVTGYKYNSYFNYKEFGTLTALKRCYEKFDFQQEPTIKIETSNDFLCLNDYNEFENFELTITTDYKIVNSNADRKDGNKHTWIFNKKNHKNKPIKFEVEKKYAEEHDSSLGIGAILVIILFIVLIILKLTVLKKDKTKANY